MQVKEGRRRVVIEGVSPEVDCGRFPAKRTAGEEVVVEADVFADGHDQLAAELRWRREGDARWHDVPMEPLVNDRWRASFPVAEVGRYRYTIRGWVDRWRTWRHDLAIKLDAGQDVAVELEVGAGLIEQAAGRARGTARADLRHAAARLREGGGDAQEMGLDDELDALMRSVPDRRFAVSLGRELTLRVDRERARFGAWYELFPRSTSTDPGRPGTFKDVIERLPAIASMGFDVLYLPPIHPIGGSFRKGRNNSLEPEPDAPGSPWAIGSEEGGHTAVHPELGTLEDFDALVAAAAEHGMEIALDLAFQTSQDHPWTREHPEWFRHRPDGSIQYAENPPKKYQDIYPIDFETEAWRELWDGLVEVVEFWIGRGVSIFRVDNPHTKSFAFWEWAIDRITAEHPGTIFLAEAFTRPKIMYRLAKLGFTQSYTYFTWRNDKWELIEYFTELTAEPVRDFFRPNLWPNTPDILHERLQTGGRGAFMMRLVLAATLGANYGIYGPAFELQLSRPLRPGSEEYWESEKYEVKHWDVDDPYSLADFIARVNAIRRANPALQQDHTLRFHPVDNDRLLAYSKRSPVGANTILNVVSLDPWAAQSGWVEFDPPMVNTIGDEEAATDAFEVRDLLTDTRYSWEGRRHFVQLNPSIVPAHILRVGPARG